MEILQIGNSIIEAGSTVVLIVLLVVLAVPQLRKKILNINGNGIEEKIIKKIETNHFHDTNGKIDRLDEKMEKMVELQQESVYILRDLKNK